MEYTVSEKLAQYGSSALSGVEHLTLLVGKVSVALGLVRHFGSLKTLSLAPPSKNCAHSSRNVEISKGTINESVAHPWEIFRSAIVHSAYAPGSGP